MAAKYIQIIFFFFLIFSIVMNSITSDTIKPQEPSQQQFENIIEALTGTEDFRNWAELLSVTDPSTFPITATFLIPSNNALSNIKPSLFDISTFAYHIIPQQLTFSLLQTFKIGSRIPTLLPNKTILVTNNSFSNYTIDDSQITYPNLYINGAIVVHGIGSVLNYSAYGGGGGGGGGGGENLHQISPVHSPDKSPSGDVHGIHHKKPRLGLHRSSGQTNLKKERNLILINLIGIIFTLFPGVIMLFRQVFLIAC